MDTIDIPQSETELPGHWWIALGKIFVSCPKCSESGSIESHSVHNGAVMPSLVCPNPKCDFHAFVQLLPKMWCPRRAESPLGARLRDHDVWETTRWDGATVWRWPWKPMTCSFCGGTRPEDVLRLLAEKWEHEYAKTYKGYLHPPGHYDCVAQMMAEMPVGPKKTSWSPVPPVKFYVQHFTKGQVLALNEAIR